MQFKAAMQRNALGLNKIMNYRKIEAQERIKELIIDLTKKGFSDGYIFAQAYSARGKYVDIEFIKGCLKL